MANPKKSADEMAEQFDLRVEQYQSRLKARRERRKFLKEIAPLRANAKDAQYSSDDALGEITVAIEEIVNRAGEQIARKNLPSNNANRGELNAESLAFEIAEAEACTAIYEAVLPAVREAVLEAVGFRSDADFETAARLAKAKAMGFKII
jgi:hypothetical protein